MWCAAWASVLESKLNLTIMCVLVAKCTHFTFHLQLDLERNQNGFKIWTAVTSQNENVSMCVHAPSLSLNIRMVTDKKSFHSYYYDCSHVELLNSDGSNLET